MCNFLLLEQLEATGGLLIGLLSMLLCLREQRGLGRGRKMRGWPVGGAVRMHTHPPDLWVSFMEPQTITVVSSEITDHRSAQQIY